MLNPPAKDPLIGDDVRDKWLGFLARAFELGYITQTEFDVRSRIVMEARTAGDITPVLREFPRTHVEAWSAAWKPLIPSSFVTPVPKQETPPAPHPLFTRAFPVIMTVLAVLVIVIGVCIELTR